MNKNLQKIFIILTIILAIAIGLYLGKKDFQAVLSTGPTDPFPAKVVLSNGTEKITPVVKVLSAKINDGVLTFVLAIKNFSILKTVEDFDNLICDPAIRTDQPIQLIFKSKEGTTTNDGSEQTTIRYEYLVKGNPSSEEIGINMDFTLGPCGNYSDNSGVAPSPASNVIANYQIEFKVMSK